MKNPIFCAQGPGKALQFAKNRLIRWGYPVEEALSPQVTHLLLPVPTPENAVPEELPKALTVIGGKLPKLPCPAVDLLEDPYYLQENAAITAECTLMLLKERTKLSGKKVLLIGWGRIGKCLASSLRLQGAYVSVAARKPEARRQLRNLGFDSIPVERLEPNAYNIIINTAPAPVLDVSGCNALCIDLASVNGLRGQQVLWARGLPGKMLPEASGTLIAKTALRYALKEEHQ